MSYFSVLLFFCKRQNALHLGLTKIKQELGWGGLQKPHPRQQTVSITHIIHIKKKKNEGRDRLGK